MLNPSPSLRCPKITHFFILSGRNYFAKEESLTTIPLGATQHNMKLLAKYGCLHAMILSVPFRRDDGIHVGQVAYEK